MKRPEFLTLDLATPSGTKRSLTDQGYLLIQDCTLARAGVFDYLAANFQPRAFNDRAATDMVRVYRSVATIEKAAVGFSGAPVTDGHPPEMLNLANTKEFQKGHINGDVKVVNGVMVADLIITDKATIAGIQEGKDQLSNGYFSEYIFEAGLSPDGESFDCEQITFRANHVAVVAFGRNGAECRVSDSDETKPKEVKTMNVTINGVSFEVTDQVAQAVSVLQGDLNSATGKLKEFGNVDARIDEAVKTSSDKLQATIDSKQAEIDTIKQDIPTADQLDAMATERGDLLVRAKELAPTLDCKGKTNAEVRSAVVLSACADLKTLDGRSADYIEARFDGLKAAKGDNKTLDNVLGNSLENNDSTIDAVADARNKAIERNGNAWKKEA